jgi:hypothetical protein
VSSRRDLVGALSALLRVIATSDSLDSVRRGSVHGHARAVAARADRGLIEPVPWTPFVERAHLPPSDKQIKALVQAGKTQAEAEMLFAAQINDRLYANSRYQVLVRDIGEGWVHLSIKRIDQLAIHDWRDLQRIKDELVGPDCEAIELYPASSRVVDQANQYHLWAVRDASYRFPVGFTHDVDDVVDADAIGSGQRVS